MSTAILSPRAAALARIKALVLDTLPSSESKRAYGQALDDFFRWCEISGSELTKATVNAYRASLEKRQLSASTINQRLSAVRRLVAEAADNQLLSSAVAAAILRVRGAKRSGVRLGHWLSKQQAEKLLRVPDGSTAKGKRDRALLAVLIGCGLRRREAAALAIEDVQSKEARWVIADLIGKGGRIRTVPMPIWTKVALDEWIAIAGISAGTVFRSLDKSGRVNDRTISTRTIFDVVKRSGEEIGVSNLAPHDLRRTFAKLATKEIPLWSRSS